jgi:hypothetical protein
MSAAVPERSQPSLPGDVSRSTPSIARYKPIMNIMLSRSGIIASTARSGVLPQVASPGADEGLPAGCSRHLGPRCGLLLDSLCGRGHPYLDDTPMLAAWLRLINHRVQDSFITCMQPSGRVHGG